MIKNTKTVLTYWFYADVFFFVFFSQFNHPLLLTYSLCLLSNTDFLQGQGGFFFNLFIYFVSTVKCQLRTVATFVGWVLPEYSFGVHHCDDTIHPLCILPATNALMGSTKRYVSLARMGKEICCQRLNERLIDWWIDE